MQHHALLDIIYKILHVSQYLQLLYQQQILYQLLVLPIITYPQEFVLYANLEQLHVYLKYKLLLVYQVISLMLRL